MAEAAPSEAVPPPDTDGTPSAAGVPSTAAPEAPDPSSKHFVLALGSAMSAERRAAAGGATGEGAPFTARGLRRSWGARVDDEGNRWSAPCVYRSSEGCAEFDACSGVVFAVEAGEMAKLDGVEPGCVRAKVSHECVEPWAGASGAALEAATATKAALEDGGVLWAYLAAPPAEEHIPDLWNPVLQSFIDLVLAGSAEHGQSFAEEFLTTTLGWGLEKGSWSNDRDEPRYKHHSEAAAAKGADWDELAKRRRPLAYSCRAGTRIGRASQAVESRAPEEWEDADEAYSSDSDEEDEEDEDEEEEEAPEAQGGGSEPEPAPQASAAVADADADMALVEEMAPEPAPEVLAVANAVRVQDGKGWKSEFFSVEGGVLTIYADETRAEKLAEIPTKLCTLSHPKSKRDDAPHCFRIDVDTAKSSSHAGWMTKQGGVRKNWKRRWFQIQLQGTELAYYDKEGGKPKGAIDLTKCQEVKTHDEDVLALSIMSLREQGVYREFNFRCDDEDDCMTWVNAINQTLAMHAAHMDQAASGGVTVGAGFQKKYIVDASTEEDLEKWFAVFGGQILERKMDGLRQWGQDKAKKAQAGASLVSKTVSEKRKDLAGADGGTDLDLEFLTADERSVLQVSVDSDIYSCARLKTAEAGTNDQGDPYIDAESEGFKALHRAVALNIPASFGHAAEDGAGGAPGEEATPMTRSKTEFELDRPVEDRLVSGSELPHDPVLLRWCERVGYQRADGGTAYAKALAAYSDKGGSDTGGSEAWVSHVMMNDWPSGLSESGPTIPFVEAERAAAPLALRLPPSDEGGVRYSLHRVDGRMLLLASGEAGAMLPRCSAVRGGGGEAEPMTEEQLKSLTMFSDAMKDPTLVPQTEEEEVKPRVVSFAQRWLEPPDFPADFEPTWSVFVNFQSSP